MARVIVTVKKDLQTKVEVDGIPGGACRIASRPALEAIGGKTISDNETGEACQVNLQQDNNIDVGGQ